MNLTEILTQAGGVQSIARQLGVTEAQASAGATALLPAILGGVKKQAQAQPEGLAGLGGLLGKLGGDLLDQGLGNQPPDPSKGNDVLGQIFGSKDVSRTVASNAASQTGLNAGLLRKMLPLVAMLVTGYMAKQTGGASQSTEDGSLGGLGGLMGSLGGLLGGSGAAAAGATTAAPGAAGASGLGGLGAMLDMNGDGNVLDDILRMAGQGRSA